MGQVLACYSPTAGGQQNSAPKVLIVGLKGAGKTTILYQLLNRPQPMIAQYRETIVGSIKQSRRRITLMEVNAQYHFQRKNWLNHLTADCQALIWVVDSHDHGKMAASRDALRTSMLRLGRVPLLVLANKDDILSAAALADVSADLDLQDHLYKDHIIDACCATTGSGLGIAIDWLEANFA